MTKIRMTEKIKYNKIIIPVVGLIEEDGMLVAKEDIVIIYQLARVDSKE